MGDVSDRIGANVVGDWYTDDSCIDCDLCRQGATAHFRRDEEAGYSYVYHQPQTDEERLVCEDVMEGCPVDAIGRDGGNRDV